MNIRMRALSVVGFFGAIASTALAAPECLKYEVVSLHGTLVRQTYPGPPDYESVTQGDRPQVVWILQLDQRICVVDPDPSLPREYNEREIQLVSRADQGLPYRDLLGARVIVTGKLLHGGARHEQRLVLQASDIKRTGVLRES